MKRAAPLTAVALAALVAHAQTPAGPSDLPPSDGKARPAADATYEALRTRLPEITFRDAPLDEVFKLIARLSGLELLVRWERLEAAGVTRDAPVTLAARNLRLDQVLWLVLNQPALQEARLAYRAQDRLILISTEEEFGQQMVVKVYDITDLLVERIRRPGIQSARTRQVPIGNTIATAGGAVAAQPIIGEVESGVVYEGEDTGGGDVDRERLIRQLIAAITATIEPSSWAVNGGPGTIVAFRDKLVIRNSPLVHQQIGGPLRAP